MTVFHVLRLALKDESIPQHDLINCLLVFAGVHSREMGCGRMGGDPSELCHHGEHLILIDGDAIPCHAVRGLPDVATDHALGHAANELLPRGLAVRAELYTCLSGVVEEFIVANPEGSVPGFVGRPTVVGAEGGSGHESFRLVDVFSLQGQRRICSAAKDSASAVTTRTGRIGSHSR